MFIELEAVTGDKEIVNLSQAQTIKEYHGKNGKGVTICFLEDVETSDGGSLQYCSKPYYGITYEEIKQILHQGGFLLITK